MSRALLAAVAALVLVTGTAGSCDKPQDKFTRDCTAKGGHVQSTGHGRRACIPPIGGWQ